MYEIELNVKGIKPLKLQVFFALIWLNLRQADKRKRPYGSQAITVCIIRRNGLILGEGIAIQHPDDLQKHDVGPARGSRRGSQERITGRRLVHARPDTNRDAWYTHKEKSL